MNDLEFEAINQRKRAQRDLRDRCELANCPDCKSLTFREKNGTLHDVFIDGGYVPGLEAHACQNSDGAEKLHADLGKALNKD